VPIIAVTGSAMSSERERGLLAGFSAYLTKPVSLREFRQILAALGNAGSNT
jgi:CheY-like chemotaxis protein